ARRLSHGMHRGAVARLPHRRRDARRADRSRAGDRARRAHGRRQQGDGDRHGAYYRGGGYWAGTRSSMKIRRVILTKSDLAALPQTERSLLLLLGHASNEINVLSKLILMVTRKDTPPSQIANNVEAGQVCVLLRVLVGQLHEAWRLLQQRVSTDRPLFNKYVRELDADGATALNNLKKHFGGTSPLTKIRSKVAFHYSDDDNFTEQSFQALAESEPLELYLTTEVGNSFYHGSELIVMSTAIRMVMSGDDAAAFGELCSIAIKVSRDITELFGQLMGVILKGYMPDLEPPIENHPDGPPLSTLSLPYFIDLSR